MGGGVGINLMSWYILKRLLSAIPLLLGIAQDGQKLSICHHQAATRRVNRRCKSAPELDQISVLINTTVDR